MPMYDWQCPVCKRRWEEYRSWHDYASGLYPVECTDCCVEAKRVYNTVNVNWNGLRPSAGEIHPKIKDLIEGAPERRDRMVKDVVHED